LASLIIAPFLPKILSATSEPAPTPKVASSNMTVWGVDHSYYDSRQTLAHHSHLTFTYYNHPARLDMGSGMTLYL
jgi:hypothetical protein